MRLFLLSSTESTSYARRATATLTLVDFPATGSLSYLISLQADHGRSSIPFGAKPHRCGI